MSFHMPTVDLDRLSEPSIEAIKPIILHGRLVTMPGWDCPHFSKLVHHFLLKRLYRDTRWMVPLHHAWYMPHLSRHSDDNEIVIASIAADIIHCSGCFGDPQPVNIGNKQYLVTREDGSTFTMKVA